MGASSSPAAELNPEIPKPKSSGLLSSFDPLASGPEPEGKCSAVGEQNSLGLPDAIAAAFKNPQGSESHEADTKDEGRLPSGISAVEHQKLMQLVQESTSKLRAPNAPDGTNSDEDPFAE